MASHQGSPLPPRWQPKNWLFQEIDEDEPMGFTIEADLKALYRVFMQGKYPQAEALWQQCDLKMHQQASQRQLARFYYLGVEITLALEKWEEAYGHARLCKGFIPAADWLSQVQLAHKQGVSELYPFRVKTQERMVGHQAKSV